MRTHWSNANDIWEIFIDDPQDPALGEFGFPDSVHGWLRSPESFVDEFAAVERISPEFFRRVRTFLGRGQVHAACYVPEGEHPDQINRPSKHHFVLIGEDGIDPFSDGRDTTGVRLVPRPEAPSWAPFPDVSGDFRAACEQLAGVFPVGISAWFLPYVLFADGWTQWREAFPSRVPGLVGVPQALEEASVETWILQKNYYGVCTLLQAPGRIVLADAEGRIRVLEDTSPEKWLARELEGGTRQQPSRADVPGGGG